jgi:hypothetical protein
MTATEEEARRRMLEVAGREIAAAQELIAEIDRRMAAWGGRAIEHPSDRLVLGELARSLKSGRAAVLLCRQGFGEQAAMLARTMFEGMLVAHWVGANQDEAVQRFVKHERDTAARYADAMQAHGWLDESAPAAVELTDLERSEFRALFGPYGERSWHGQGGVHDLLESVIDQWSDAEAQASLRAYVDVPQRILNRLLHSTVTSLGQTVRSGDEAPVRFVAGPSDNLVPQALFSVVFTLVQLFSLIVDHFRLPDRDGFERVGNRCSARFRSVDQALLSDAGRKDPCPCGSGLKTKHCHRA